MAPDYLNLWNIFNLAARAVILVFTLLALLAALGRARGHLPWLLPMTLGQGLLFLGSLLNLLFIATIRASGFSGAWRWLTVPMQALFTLGTLCLAWAAVALFLTLRAALLPPLPLGSAAREEEGWPPPPTRP